MTKVVVVWVKVYTMEVNVEVKVEVVWTDEVFAETLALLTGQCFVVKLALLPHCHLEGARSMGYI